MLLYAENPFSEPQMTICCPFGGADGKGRGVGCFPGVMFREVIMFLDRVSFREVIMFLKKL
jgi:hypothetical protein